MSLSRRLFIKAVLAGGATQLLSACGLSKTTPTKTNSFVKSSPSLTPTSPMSSDQDPILFVVGDLVSERSIDRAEKVVRLIQTLMAEHAGRQMLVISVGDNEQGEAPTLLDYQTSFENTYGIFVKQGIFRPVRGNHDLLDAGHGQAYAEYFKAATHFDEIPIANGEMNYNYSFDLGDWHIVGVDQVDSTLNPAGLAFLKSDLTMHSRSKYKLVYWHAPTYCSSLLIHDALSLIPFNEAAYQAGVDIQINGHTHVYQRFHPINPFGERDDKYGITTFIAGIGGENGDYGFKPSRAQAASAIFKNTFSGGDGNHVIGVLMLTLHAGSADFAAYNANNGLIFDEGVVYCHHKTGRAAI
ncbi:MAG: metallophosphoesterase [Anaerolineaceae bacterium]|nr:metallophosphoesterase [Anaerolineaceae bacterium]